MVDDMGFSDLGCYGGEISTPTIDRLATNGVRFTNFSNGARCCAPRASLLTGLYPHQAGIGHMTNGNIDEPRSNQDVDADGYQGFLNERCTTIAEVLRPAGYKTYMSGKWHVGLQPEYWPVKRGFDRHFGLIGGACNYFDPEPERFLVDGDEAVEPWPGFYTTDAFSDHAVQYIDEHTGNDPFFLYLAYTAPHWPLHAWSEDIERYRGTYMDGWDALRERRFARQKELGFFGPEVELSPRDSEAPPWDSIKNKEEWDLRMAVYAAMVDRMDQGLGRVVDALKRGGHFEDTLILFLSDNGACAESYDAAPGVPPGPEESATGVWLPWANASNTPFRLFKHFAHEGGINTPFIAHWTNGIKTSRIESSYAAHVKDIPTTIYDLAGVDPPQERDGIELTQLEGKSFAGVLESGPGVGQDAEGDGGASAGRRAPNTTRAAGASAAGPPAGTASTNDQVLFWEHEGNRAVRDGDWKLVSYYGEGHGFSTAWSVGRGCRVGPWELYNLADDPTELHDRAAEEPERAATMIAAYKAYAERTGVVDWETIQKTRGRCP